MSSPISKRSYIKDYIRLYKYMEEFHKDPANTEVIAANTKRKKNEMKKEQKDKRRVYDREYKRKSRSSKKAPGPAKLVIETGTFELSFD